MGALTERLAEGDSVRNYGFTRSVIPMVDGRFHAKLEWRQDPPPAPLTAERPEYLGTSWAATFDTRAEANNALDAKIAELRVPTESGPAPTEPPQAGARVADDLLKKLVWEAVDPLSESAVAYTPEGTAVVIVSLVHQWPMRFIAAMPHAQAVEVNEWTGDPTGAYCALCSEIVGNYVNWPCRFAPKEGE